MRRARSSSDDGTDDPAGALASQTTRGFTGHEQLTEVGLVYMNGRVYDPLIGRFGAPDPMTESPYSTQGWNRYSYVGNSPLNFADPSGYCFLGCFWQKPFKALAGAIRRTPILGNILQVAGTAICAFAGGGPVCGPLVSAIITGLASGDLGQALKAGFISAVTVGAFEIAGNLTGGLGLNGILDPQLGGHGPLEFLSEAHVFNIATHAAIGCGSAVLSGGKCGPGALSGAIGSFSSHLPFAQNLNRVGKLMLVSTSGGLASMAGGGKFGNGALTAAFGYLFNELGTNEERGYGPAEEEPALGDCALQCAAEHYGLIEVAKYSVAAPGAPIPKKWLGFPPRSLGSGNFTTPLSALGFRKGEYRMSYRFFNTKNFLRVGGRFLGVVGAAMLIYDAGSIGHCTYQCMGSR